MAHVRRIQIRLGVGANAFALLLFAAVPVLLGIIARAQFPDLEDQQLALPTLLRYGMPPLIGGLGLAALFSAELSSADAILLMLTTSLSQDLYRRFVHPKASDQHVLWFARGTAVVARILGILLAIAAKSIIAVITVFYTLLTVSLFVPVIGGLYIRRLGTPEALASIAAGVGLMIVLELSEGKVHLTGSKLTSIGLGAAILTSIIAMVLLNTSAWLRRSRGEMSQLHDLPSETFIVNLELPFVRRDYAMLPGELR